MNNMLKSFNLFRFSNLVISNIVCCTPRSSHFVLPQRVLPLGFKCYNTFRFCCNQKVQIAGDSGVGVEKNEFDMTDVTCGDPDLEKKLKILFLEVDVMRQEGAEVPQTLKPEQWKELLDLKSRSMRSKYLRFLWKVEIKKLNRLKKKAERKEMLMQKLPAESEDPHIDYGLSRNTIFLRIYDKTINQLYNSKLITAMMFGQKLVLDCGYDSCMQKREAHNCAKQLMLLFSENRVHNEPFDLYFCNVNRESETMKELNVIIPPLYEDYFPLNITEKSYLEVFPKEKIVYLTPDCREELTEFDHDAVYVIGAIVDKRPLGPVTMAKAKKEGVKMAKLPLDRYLSWGAGSGKTLTLNQMVQILLDIKQTGDWVKALSHVPRRKLISNLERVVYNNRRKNNFEYRR